MGLLYSLSQIRGERSGRRGGVVLWDVTEVCGCQRLIFLCCSQLEVLQRTTLLRIVLYDCTISHGYSGVHRLFSQFFIRDAIAFSHLRILLFGSPALPSCSSRNYAAYGGSTSTIGTMTTLMKLSVDQIRTLAPYDGILGKYLIDSNQLRPDNNISQLLFQYIPTRIFRSLIIVRRGTKGLLLRWQKKRHSVSYSEIASVRVENYETSPLGTLSFPRP